jgi:hypothetical protein
MVVSREDASIAVVKALNALYGPISPTYGFLDITKCLTARSIYAAQRAGTAGVSKAQRNC